MTDIDAIMDLLTPLAVAGITRMRSRREIMADLHDFTVVQRENKARLRSLSCLHCCSQPITCAGKPRILVSVCGITSRLSAALDRAAH